MSNVLLALDNVHKAYSMGDNQVGVLTGASLAVHAGELVALVAPSGAGKSTLLHIAGLLETPDQGELYIDGQTTHNLSERDRTTLRRTSIGFVYQFHHLLPEFTALENVVMPMMIAGNQSKQHRQFALDLLKALGVGHRADHRPSELSGGEQQRVAIARAAANRPHIILADEPTGNLDPGTSDLVFTALSGVIRAQNSACLFVTHDVSLAQRADRVITLNAGQITQIAI